MYDIIAYVRFMKEKHYYSLDKFYKKKFGQKVVKVSIDAGFTCPNKDGKKNLGGCIFCNGSTLVGNSSESIITQFKKTVDVISKKWKNAKYIPFLEANTNTYGNLEKLKSIYEPLLSLPNVVGLNIATRCDSITNEVYDYLEELNKRTYLTIELGLQSSFNDSLNYLNRGHTKEEFTNCVKELKKRGIAVVAHLINGIPNETEDMMIQNVLYLNALNIDGIKFHMLYIEDGTTLASMYKKGGISLLKKDEYIRILGNQIKLLNSNIVIHRLISDPNREKLIAPKWLEGKFRILNEIDKYFEEHNIYQGQK